MPKRNEDKFVLKNKTIYKLRCTEGDSKVTKYNKEKGIREETGELRHWKRWTFAIANGGTNNGFANVEYWQTNKDKPLIEKGVLKVALFHLKQVSWKVKNPQTMVDETKSNLILVMDDFNGLINPNVPPEHNVVVPAKDLTVKMTAKQEDQKMLDIGGLDDEAFRKMLEKTE